MNIGGRIKELRGTETCASFCRKFNIHRNTLPRYESGETIPDGEFISIVCTEYKVHTDWLILGRGPKYWGDTEQEAADLEDFNYIPMVEAKLSAGGGAFVNSENIKGYYAFQKIWIKRITSNPKNLVLLRVTGDSMSPTIQNHDTVMIDTNRKDIEEGNIYAIRFDHTIMIKRLSFRPNEKILVISENRKDYEPYEVSISDLYIIGQVIFFSRVLVPE